MSANPNIILKALKLIVLLLLFLCSSLSFFGQKQLTGLWVGTLTNDSNTIRKEQSYEIALTEYRGKVYGYSRSEFIINDTLYYILKRVRGTIDGDICEITDDEIISYNFLGKLDKGVKVINTFRKNRQDSTWQLVGNWKTKKTKKYYSLTGTLQLKEEKDLNQSKLFPHLEELNLANDVVFYKEQKNISKPVIIYPPDKAKEPVLAKADLQKQNKNSSILKRIDTITDNEPVTVSTIPEPQNTEVAISKETTSLKADSLAIAKKIIIEEPISTVPLKKEQVTEINNPEIKKSSLPDTISAVKIKLPEVTNNGPAAFVYQRNTLFSPPISFKSDSLQLSLYDNGEIDGDTVSVLLNGKIIIAQECLKASAIKRTIHVPAGNYDSLVIVLYAENLGKYPPNTGLLIIHDGDDVYQVGFSADLQTNAALVLKRKRSK